MDPRIEAEVLAAMAANRDRTLRPSEPSRVAADVYTDPCAYARELERVIRPGWFPVARTQDLARPGDHVAVELAGDSVAVVRGEDGAIHAFHDVCLHRGARILRAPRGCATRITCPYHGFTYDTTGTLCSLPAPDSFEHVRAGDALPRARHLERHGWVWVSLGEEPSPFEGEAGSALDDELANWPLASLEAKDAKTLDVDFGWKVGVEAFLEPFHVPTIHPRTANPLVDHRGMAVRELGEHSRMALPFRASNAYAADGVFGQAAAAAGIELFPDLNEAQRSAHFVYLVFPSTVLMLLPNHLLFLCFLPLEVGRARLHYELLAAPAASDSARAWYDSLRVGYDQLLDEDLENLPWIQRGVADSTFQRVNLSGYEERVVLFRRALAARVDGATPGR